MKLQWTFVLLSASLAHGSPFSYVANSPPVPVPALPALTSVSEAATTPIMAVSTEMTASASTAAEESSEWQVPVKLSTAVYLANPPAVVQSSIMDGGPLSSSLPATAMASSSMPVKIMPSAPMPADPTPVGPMPVNPIQIDPVPVGPIQIGPIPVDPYPIDPVYHTVAPVVPTAVPLIPASPMPAETTSTMPDQELVVIEFVPIVANPTVVKTGEPLASDCEESVVPTPFVDTEVSILASSEYVPSMPMPVMPMPSVPIPAVPMPPVPAPSMPMPIEPMPSAPMPSAPMPAVPVPPAPIPVEAVQYSALPAPVPAEPLYPAPIPVEPVHPAPVPVEPMPSMTIPAEPVTVEAAHYTAAPPPVEPIPWTQIPAEPASVDAAHYTAVPVPAEPIPSAPMPVEPMPPMPPSLVPLPPPMPAPVDQCASEASIAGTEAIPKIEPTATDGVATITDVIIIDSSSIPFCDEETFAVGPPVGVFPAPTAPAAGPFGESTVAVPLLEASEDTPAPPPATMPPPASGVEQSSAETGPCSHSTVTTPEAAEATCTAVTVTQYVPEKKDRR
ncbi:hypothetical protein GGI04_002201 [Coemansia thaxteri]|nr:hypothetical protein GGI04_002201 [Coemansia thaxteri]